MPAPHSRISVLTLVALGLLLIWDVSGGDLWLAHQAGSATGFPLRDNFWLTRVLHEGGRIGAWLLWLVLLPALCRPACWPRSLDRKSRWQLIISVLAAVLIVNILKYVSHSSCPWSLEEFGGTATYVPHWLWRNGDGGPGRCFPAGHASAGFAFMTAWFSWCRSSPITAAAWLGAAMAAGLILGVGQQLRGAHFMSHTLWTAWICWVTGWVVDIIFHWHRPEQTRVPDRRSSRL